MKMVKTAKLLLGKSSGKAVRPARQPKPKKQRRPLAAVLLGAAVWLLLDWQEEQWKRELWNPEN